MAPECRHSLSSSSDALAIATFLLGARHGADVRVHGTVSPSLLRHLEEVSRMWSLWRPGKYAAIGLSADVEAEATSSHPDEAVACFSGGVDGSFTAYRHSQGRCGRQRRNVKAGLLVHGFDIALDDPARFARACEGAARSLRSIGLELIGIRTNLRALGVDWEDGFGAAMAASLSLLKGRFGKGLLGSDERYDYVTPRGSTPLVDPLFSTEAFRVIHDGAGFSRTQKVQLLSEWPEGVANLRVCWEGTGPSHNCGRCEKCIRTILNFRAVEAGLPACFPGDVTNDDIARMPVRGPGQLNELVGILEEARRRGRGGDSWVKAVERRITLARRGPSHIQRLRSRLALRTRWQSLGFNQEARTVCAS